ncbi:hypothetical protein [Xanthobacter sp. KR7-225]|uniref:hypothetical protein n=1 Tax=Xanthobacter sp. KR7-225 TaxID=3156613 RepID=UPI0032B44752
MADGLSSGGAAPQAAGAGFWLRELPYLAILLLTVGGVAYVSMERTPIVPFWELVAVASCATCIYSGWHDASDKDERWHLVWTQLLHWGAFLAAMNLVFLPSVQAVADADSTSLIVLLLLALGTFVAGVHTASWRMGLNGVVMGLCVPAVAWLDQSALFVALAALVIVAGGAGLMWAYLKLKG